MSTSLSADHMNSVEFSIVVGLVDNVPGGYVTGPAAPALAINTSTCPDSEEIRSAAAFRDSFELTSQTIGMVLPLIALAAASFKVCSRLPRMYTLAAPFTSSPLAIISPMPVI